MKQRWGLLIGLAGYWIWSGCLDPGEIELPAVEKKMSLYSQLTPSQPVSVSLFESQDFQDTSQFDYPEEALIVLSGSNGLRDTLLKVHPAGHSSPSWKSRIYPIPGVEYDIEASVAGFSTIHSQTVIPPYASQPAIFYDPIELKPVSIGGNYKLIDLSATIHLPEFPEDNRYYSIYIYIERAHYEIIEGTPVIKSYSFTTPVIFTPVSVSDFVGYGLDKSVLIRKDYWDENRDIDFRIRYTYHSVNEKPLKIYYEWRTLSPSYYQYHYALSRQQLNDPLSELVTLLNNIENGYGHFSGFNHHKDSLFFAE